MKMKTIKKNVYYCDFCNKKSLAAYVITKHENGCTANPERECKMCKNGNPIMDIVAGFKSRFTLMDNSISLSDIENGGNMDEMIVTWTGEPITLEEIKKKVSDCPTCVLAVLRQTGMNRHYFHFEYDYKKEFEAAMLVRNDLQREEYY